MKDPNKYGVYWVAKGKDKNEHGLICVAEDKHYAEVIKDALTVITVDSPIRYVVSTDYSLES